MDIIGHEAAEARFLKALASGRIHHAWLITGPRGIGKASLAFQMAAHLLSGGGGPSLFGDEVRLDLDENNPAVRQMRAGSHPDFRVIARAQDPKTGELKGEISVDLIRGLSSFLGSTAAMGGWRVVIIDAADDMNRNAANALLKMLEEPPQKSVFLVISHAPGKLLPTIRSRCLHLALKPLSDAQVVDIISPHLEGLSPDELAELASLSRGSPGLALEIAEGGGAEIYAAVYQIFSQLPALDMRKVFDLAQLVGQGKKQNAFATFAMVLNRMIEDIILWSSGAQTGPQWSSVLPLGGWLEFYDEMNTLITRGDSVNLDPRHVVLSLFGNLKRRIGV